MFLKRLEVSGFKSFADNIKLDFEPGVTAVVGPNGCGKSNIVDAIRWCLGEMSAKSLRSSMMLDVIFNGSGSRPPKNMAEVTLVFDNSSKRLPIDFTEVSIGRRLFRSGESEYFINKSQCRLRDIRELFLDTGMGEDGYSFMAQGKVEWILQAKPEERRELFEEAAGVSKYRARREEASRKLDRVEIDLSRINDIVTVTQEQIRKLENAVSRAKRYQEIRADLKKTEISDWLFQLQNGDSNLAEIQTRLEQAKNQMETLNTQLRTKESDVANLRLQNAETEEELLKANTHLNSIETQIKINEERQNNAIQREEELGEQSTNITHNIHREKGRIQELSDQKSTQELSFKTLQTENENIEPDFQAAQKSHDEALQNLESKRTETTALRNQILQRSQDRNRIQEDINAATLALSKFESDGEARQKEQVRLNNQTEELSNNINVVSVQIEDFKKQLQTHEADLQQFNQQLNQIKEKENSLREENLAKSELIAGLKGQIESVKGQQSKDPYLAGSNEILAQNFPGIQGPISRLIKTEESDRDLVAATLGEHLSDLVADTREVAQIAIEFLARENKGRARIWILDEISAEQHTEPQANSIINKINCDFKYKTLISNLCASLNMQGATVHGLGFINGGMNPSEWKSHGLLRLDELEDALKQHEAQKSYGEDSLKALELEKSDINSKREKAFSDVENTKIRLQVSIEENEKLNERLTQLKDESSLVQNEITQLLSEKDQCAANLTQFTNQLNQIQEQEKEDHSKLDSIQHELTELQQIHSQATADLSAKQERYNSYKEKLSWQSNIIAQIDADLENINKNIQHYEESLEKNAAEIEIAQKNQTEAKQNIDSLLGDRQSAAETCEGIQKRRVELAEGIQKIDSELSALRKQFEQFQEQVHNEELNQTSLRGTLESIHQKIQDQYEMSLDQAKEQFQAQQADAEILEKLKKRVSNMGPVNLAAPQEHAELLEKSTFLTNQQADLLKAKDDLREVISKINATTREHFRETFHKVRENFRELYSKLFQGGEADLHFTNEADILTTGIDIFCQPPGKKLLHISLMSGGEKALTAIALLFAFFQVRPSPVALLDEVDAPLDESNVTRYAEIVDQFSEKSQFIVISHNKRTMEKARSLYGVTMEELGVSKVISTRLVREKKEKDASVESEQTPA